jgi:hypothetical protein
MVGELNFDRTMGIKMDEVRNHLSLVFHRYLVGETGINRVIIRMNNMPITPADPFLIRHNTQVMADEVIYIKGTTVTVRPYILPHISDMTPKEIEAIGGKEGLLKSQGFYVYRNKRLLVWGTWFRMMRKAELSKLARVLVDISNELDNLWTLDIKKSTAVPPEIVRDNLASIIERLAIKSTRTWEYRGKKETHESLIHIGQRDKGKQGGYYYGINRDHPLVEIFENSPPQTKRNLETFIEQLEGVISSVINTAFADERPSDEEFENKANEIRNSLNGMLPVTDEEFANIKRRLRANIEVRIELGIAIKNKIPHQSWLPSRRADEKFFFWQRYKKYLEEMKHWYPSNTAKLDQVSDDIVDLLGDPKSNEP